MAFEVADIDATVAELRSRGGSGWRSPVLARSRDGGILGA
jgi:hypothetical protein